MGDPSWGLDYSLITDDIIERFWSKVDIKSNDDCWIWTAGRFPSGYGAFKALGKQWRATRFSWSLNNKTIIDSDLVVCHTCDNPPCVNPNHLFAATHKDNQYDSIFKGRHSSAKLTEKEKEMIRKLYSNGDITQKELGNMFSVDPSTVSDVVNSEPYNKGGQ